MIRAPFNFVPLSEHVFFPKWAGHISHDIPFSDGESGEIELTITAETPIFVRNGHTRNDSTLQNDKYMSFNQHNGQLFIPGTSIKGTVRNVLEIMSFGKMDRIANHRYSLRDLQLKEEYLSFFQNSDVHCGWLRKEDDDKLILSDHGIPRRISHKDLDAIWGTNLDETFKDGYLLKKDSNRNAIYKIRLTTGKPKTIRYDEFAMNSKNPVDKRIMANYDPKGMYSGTIVLTGQPSARKDRVKNSDGTTRVKGSGKCFEFVFPETQIKEYSISAESEVFLDFCFIYKDSDDWKYWRKELSDHRTVPVFFSVKNNEEINHLGLSYLYKLPYGYRVKDCLPVNHKESQKIDLCECIFGVSNSQLNQSLRGRVQFTHAFLFKGEVSHVVRSPYMASPKSSYYPIYLKQNGSGGDIKGNFLTYMSTEARLKGWKKYPVRENISDFSIPQEVKVENLSPFYPVNEGAIFKTKLKFHNLRKTEIGAILKSVLLSRQGCSHSIGFAKPYGYGRIKIEMSNHSVLNHSIDEYINEFNQMMNTEIPGYDKSIQLKELLLMSKPQELNTQLEYMELSEFVGCKRHNPKKDIHGKYLPDYSEMIKKAQPVIEAVVQQEALVTLVAGSIMQAKLLEGKDLNSKPLVVLSGKIRPKKGDLIIVKVLKKGGNIEKLEFIKRK